MIRVRVEYVAALAILAGTRKDVVTLEAGATVAELVRHLSDRAPDLANVLMREGLYSRLLVSVNGKEITAADSVRAKLMSGDTILFTTALAGG